MWILGFGYLIDLLMHSISVFNSIAIAAAKLQALTGLDKCKSL